jgi:putative endonuclease
MKTQKQEIGQVGEDKAAAFLTEKGYCIITRNFRSGRNELDIICTDQTDLVIVEVKSVRNPAFGAAESRIPKRKQQSIMKAAYAYLNYHREFAGKSVRFDVICINFTRVPAEINHYQSAFWQSW